MTIKERYKGILDYFQQAQPNPETELQHRDPFELLVAVGKPFLGYQTQDKYIDAYSDFYDQVMSQTE